MKFLVDAQLPPSLAKLLVELGHDAIHTVILDQGNDTPDPTINKITLEQKRTLITKDIDFYHSFTVKAEPYKLLIVRTGNINTADLKNLFRRNMDNILTSFESGRLIELTREEIRIVF